MSGARCDLRDALLADAGHRAWDAVIGVVFLLVPLLPLLNVLLRQLSQLLHLLLHLRLRLR
jgi:hypothetical protein